MEDEFVTREKKILSIVKQEIEDGEEMAVAVRHMTERMLLGEKGYAPSDIETKVSFNVTLGKETVTSFVDFLVSSGSRHAMVIKCAAGSLSSRERHVVAAARVLESLPVPIAVVIDPMSAVVLDTATEKVIGEGFESESVEAGMERPACGERSRSPLLPKSWRGKNACCWRCPSRYSFYRRHCRADACRPRPCGPPLFIRHRHVRGDGPLQGRGD